MRSRLIDAIDIGVCGTVTVVSAGAGWGKTTLAASWTSVRSQDGPIAWLTLRDEHNDPDLFWSDLVRALATVGVVLPGDPPAVDGLEFQQWVGSGMARLRTATVVVLDDVHKLVDRRVLGGLGGLLRRAPALLRLVLCGRHARGFSLHQLRTAGQLTEIGAADLGFRVDEAADLLAELGRRDPIERLTEVVRRVEGWPAGVRLSLQAGPGPFAERAAETYLIEDVLAEEPAIHQWFLLLGSVPDRMCGALADALTGRQDGQRMLEQLAEANVFVEPVGAGPWFRYHPTFRSAMRRQLQSTMPERVPGLHLRAARWHAAEGDILPALNHGAAAADWQLVAELVAGHGLMLFAGPDRLDFAEVLDRIPSERLSDSPELALCGALVAYHRGDLKGMFRPIETVRAMRAAGRPGLEAIDVALGLTESSTLVRWQGDMPRLLEISHRLIADIAAVDEELGRASVQYRTMALSNKAVALLWLGQLDHADRYLWAAASGARASGMPLVAVSALGHLALLAFFRGSVREAEEHATAAMAIARRIDAESRPGAAAARLARALIDSERGLSIEANEEMCRALRTAGEIPEASLRVVAALVRARLLTDRGDGAGARASLHQAWTEARPGLVSPLLASLTELAEAEIDLALGEPAVVVDRYSGGRRLSPSEQICLARAGLADPHSTDVEALLGLARTSSDRISAVTAWVLIARIEDTRGHRERAGEALRRALTLAEPEGIRRPFRHLDASRMFAGAELQQWLTEARRPPGHTALAEITGELPAVVPANLPLSDRELEVLQYLPTLLTAGEIADNLHISVNTVKAHLRSIYRKLGAGRRRQAVLAARQLSLL